MAQETPINIQQTTPVNSYKKGYGKRGNSQETEIIFTVVTRLEISRLKQEIDKIDPNAFIVTQSINDTHGGMVKKRPLTH